MSMFPLTRRIHNVISAVHSNEIIFLIDCFKSKNGICHPTVEHRGNFFQFVYPCRSTQLISRCYKTCRTQQDMHDKVISCGWLHLKLTG